MRLIKGNIIQAISLKELVEKLALKMGISFTQSLSMIPAFV